MCFRFSKKSLLLPGLLLAASHLVDPAHAAGGAAYLQYSSVVATGQTISISRLPVVAGGVTSYEDVVISLAVNSSGELSYSPKLPTVTASPAVLVTSIPTGSYVDSSNSSYGFTISGPGVTQGGYSLYSITLTPGKSCTTVAAPSVFYVGTLASTPIAARVAKAGIPTSQYTVGEAGTGGCAGDNWPSNGLVGFSMVGNTLIVSSFSTTNGTIHDSATAVDSRSYNLQN